MLELGLENWNLLIAVIIPIAVGVVTKLNASSAVKAVTMLVFTTINALAEQAINNDGLLTEETLRAGVTSLVVSIALYYGVYKPTTVTQTVQEKTANVGVGGHSSYR